MNDLIDSILSMQLDVYRQLEIQDSDTGAIKREWNYHRTVECHAKGVISNSATTRARPIVTGKQIGRAHV